MTGGTGSGFLNLNAGVQFLNLPENGGERRRPRDDGAQREKGEGPEAEAHRGGKVATAFSSGRHDDDDGRLGVQRRPTASSEAGGASGCSPALVSSTKMTRGSGDLVPVNVPARR